MHTSPKSSRRQCPTSITLSPLQLVLVLVCVQLAREAASFAHARYFGHTTTLPASHSASSSDASSSVRFKFPPAVKRIIVNVGSNVAPPVPKSDDIAVIAVEPMLPTAWAIPKHERVYVITAAIAGTAGFANFFSYNVNGESSSLTEMAQEDKGAPTAWWAADSQREKGYPPVNFVPVLTMRMLLDAIPADLEIILLKTDMQGYDFTAVSTAGDALRRVKQLYSEVNCHGFAYNPSAPLNDFDAVWGNYMAGMQYILNPRVQCPPQPCESNALWTRPGATVPDGIWWD